MAFGVVFVDFEVGEIGDQGAVDPCFDIGALGDDAEVVPFAVFEVLVGDELFLGGEPAAAGGLAVDVSGFGSVLSAGFGLDLGSVEASAEGAFFGIAEEGADLATGVEAVVDLGFELEFEVAVLFVGDEEGVGAAGVGGADDGAVLDLVGGVSAFDGPAGEVFSIEGLGPLVGGSVESEGSKEGGEGKFDSHIRWGRYGDWRGGSYRG